MVRMPPSPARGTAPRGLTAAGGARIGAGQRARRIASSPRQPHWGRFGFHSADGTAVRDGSQGALAGWLAGRLSPGGFSRCAGVPLSVCVYAAGSTDHFCGCGARKGFSSQARLGNHRGSTYPFTPGLCVLECTSGILGEAPDGGYEISGASSTPSVFPFLGHFVGFILLMTPFAKPLHCSLVPLVFVIID